ncbi:PRC-barrel domain-containing protein [Niallia sp. 03133]|uniref:PRC-barrel domain-containing protein n=1 Tax=Niallia sp. 03133 TaxID=3458060 RepID=UPI0040439D56
MKNSSQIKGLPIINILDGKQEGNVQSLIINPEKGSVDFLTIEQEEWQESIQAIPFKKVIGVGEYAVTIESANSIIDLNEIPIARELVDKKITVADANVITRKGELLGKVVEYYVNDENGDIIGLGTTINDKESFILSEYVVTYGKDIIIVKEEAATNLQSSIFEKETAALESAVMEETVIVEDSSEMETTTEEERLQALKEKQMELLTDKKVIKDIYTNDGEILFTEGTILTAEDIEKAQNIGLNVVIELSMSVEA